MEALLRNERNLRMFIPLPPLILRQPDLSNRHLLQHQVPARRQTGAQVRHGPLLLIHQGRQSLEMSHGGCAGDAEMSAHHHARDLLEISLERPERGRKTVRDRLTYEPEEGVRVFEVQDVPVDVEEDSPSL